VTHAKGLNRCAVEKIAHRFHVALLLGAAAASTPKGSGTLTTCGVLDQGQTGTCHAHSLCGAVYCALASAAAGAPPPFVGSPRQLAGCVYSDVRAAATPVGQPVPSLLDTGADLQDDATALAGWGLAPIQAPTSDGRYSDVENDPPNNVFPEPDPTQLQKVMQVTGEYSIPVNSAAPNLVALCIDGGVPVQVGFFCDSAFENLTAGQVATVPNQSDPNGGGHACYLYGYRTASDGSFEFLLRNSWGNWCQNGDCWVSTAWLLAAWELFPVAVKAVATTTKEGA
jgi:hypothetical protein